MTLSVREKSNIRHFSYYLINGTLDFDLIQETFGNNYYDKLKDNAELFYKTACVYINQEKKLKPSWPDTKKLGKFICQLYTGNINSRDFENWEIDFTTHDFDFSSDFKQFTKWFIETNVVEDISYKNYVSDGASFVEQCFAIWANAVILENNKVINFEHSIERVEQYIKSYYIEGYIDNLEEWECELYME
jgi:hypothetical protein